ncbi:hypothetical protein [Bradyrhizobium sp.]|uniref:hypothetical protein n=1 Tax=Bradyrhizobium sp. TaxID=376 RepID=UPI0025C725EC|nr:hypothetical protein [Bradyrhizobium sp.]
MRTNMKPQPKRRCLMPRRRHPDLDFFFRRYDRIRREAGVCDDGTEPDCHIRTTETLPLRRH